MKGRSIKYSKQELAFIEEHKALSRRKLLDTFRARFRRDDVSLSNIGSLCKRKGWLTGRTGCFQKGATPANKGKKMPYNPRSAAHWFKTGREPHNTKWEGHERLSKQGYVEISVRETNPHTGYERRYILKHRWLWEKSNGPVPDGHALKCLDGNRTNCDPDNWIALPRSMLPRLNGRSGRNYDHAPAEIKPVIMTTARLAQSAADARARKKKP